jgi:hypothetical protein
MKYDIKMGSVAMIHIPVFIQTDSNIQKLTGGDTQTYRHTDTQRGWKSHNPTFIFSIQEK